MFADLTMRIFEYGIQHTVTLLLNMQHCYYLLTCTAQAYLSFLKWLVCFCNGKELLKIHNKKYCCTRTNVLQLTLIFKSN